jgi:hypothetical protein
MAGSGLCALLMAVLALTVTSGPAVANEAPNPGAEPVEGPLPPPQSETEPNDTFQTADIIAHGQPFTGTVTTANDVDKFTFYLMAPEPLNVAVTATGSCAVTATLAGSFEQPDRIVVPPDATRHLHDSELDRTYFDLEVTGCTGATYTVLATGSGLRCGYPGGPDYLEAAKLRIARAQVLNDARQLDVLGSITSRASGGVEVYYQADGRMDRFFGDVSPVAEDELSRIRFRGPITAGQARLGTGIVTINYPGDADTRGQQVRLRAARRQAKLRVDRIALSGNRLSAEGRVTRLAEGIVRLRFSYLAEDGTPQMHLARARIQDDGGWGLADDQVPPQLARCGGYLSILFTGYFERRVRGEMLAYQLYPQSVRTPTTEEPAFFGSPTAAGAER